jgi:hypothetical protein
MLLNLGRRSLDHRSFRRIIPVVVLAGGLAALATPAAASYCRQPGHVWFGPNPVAQFGTIFLTGVTCPGTSARFLFRDGAGNVVWDQTTHPSRSNCVIHHEPEYRTVFLEPGSYSVEGQFFDDWCRFTSQSLGSLTVTRRACTVRCSQGVLDPDTCTCQCYEGAEQNCLDSGGFWNSQTCTCNYIPDCRFAAPQLSPERPIPCLAGPQSKEETKD